MVLIKTTLSSSSSPLPEQGIVITSVILSPGGLLPGSKHDLSLRPSTHSAASAFMPVPCSETMVAFTVVFP